MKSMSRVLTEMVKHQEKYMNFSEAFNYYAKLIRSNEPFAFSRFGDGEASLMMGNGISRNTQAWVVDRWEAPVGESAFGEELRKSFSHTEDNFHYGLPTVNCPIHQGGVQYLLENCKSANISFAALWINANYNSWKGFINSLTKEVVVIANKKPSSPFPFPSVDYSFIDNCVLAYEADNTVFDKYIQLALEYDNTTFFISAGPAACILVSKMYQLNPSNQYIDVGSALDEYVYGKITRPYMDSNSIYSQQVSYR